LSFDGSNVRASLRKIKLQGAVTNRTPRPESASGEPKFNSNRARITINKYAKERYVPRFRLKIFCITKETFILIKPSQKGSFLRLKC
jgi:hypothetical protein